MNNLNSILIEGYLTRDPELTTTHNNTAVYTFTIALNRFYKLGNTFEHEVSYFDVTTWSLQGFFIIYTKGKFR